MKAKMLNTEDAGINARNAAIRASIYSDQCRGIWSGKDRARAESFLHCAQAAYSGVRDEPTYRKTFITVRIDGPVKDRAAARVLDEIAEQRGYEKVRTNQTLIYRIR